MVRPGPGQANMEGFMSGWNRRPSRATSQWLAHGSYTIMSSSRHLPMLMWKSLQKERRSHEAQSLLQQHRHCQPLATSSHFIQGLLPKDTAIIPRWAASRFKVQGVCVCVCVCVCVPTSALSLLCWVASWQIFWMMSLYWCRPLRRKSLRV